MSLKSMTTRSVERGRSLALGWAALPCAFALGCSGASPGSPAAHLPVTQAGGSATQETSEQRGGALDPRGEAATTAPDTRAIPPPPADLAPPVTGVGVDAASDLGTGPRHAEGAAAENAPAAPTSSGPPRDWRAALAALRTELADASSREELEAALGSIASLLQAEGEAMDYMELLQTERAINAEVTQWIRQHGTQGVVAEREACLADLECSVGRCAGPGCVPGQWRCVIPAGPGDRHTTDMRTACLCRGGTFQGSSTTLRSERVRYRGGACPEELPRPIRPR